jgi:membrane protease YdiL (CAAX protease family)
VSHHRNGFPNGIVDASLAFAFGIMLGFLRRKSRGMLGCWLAHAAVDSAIYCMVCYFIRASVK